MAFFGMKAALGRTSRDLATNLRTERERRAKGREAKAQTRYASNVRVGEQTLLQQLKEASPEFQAKIGLTKQQTETSAAQGGAAAALTAGRTAQNDTYNSLSDEQRQQLAMTEGTNAQTNAAREARIGAPKAGPAATIIEAEGQLMEFITVSRGAWDWPAVIDKARELGLTKSNSDLYKDWSADERGLWAKALAKELEGGGDDDDIIDDLVGLPGQEENADPNAAIEPLMASTVMSLGGGTTPVDAEVPPGEEVVESAPGDSALPGVQENLPVPAVGDTVETVQRTPVVGDVGATATDAQTQNQAKGLAADPGLVAFAIKWGLNPDDPEQLMEAKRRADLLKQMQASGQNPADSLAQWSSQPAMR